MKKKKVKTTKERIINIRCTADQKSALEMVASREGLGLSTWLLHVGLLAAEDRRSRKEAR